MRVPAKSPRGFDWFSHALRGFGKRCQKLQRGFPYFHELPWHHGFPQRYFKLWNLSHDAVGARPDRQDARGAVCRAALQRCQVRLWRWMLMAQGESEVTAGANPAVFFRRSRSE